MYDKRFSNDVSNSFALNDMISCSVKHVNEMIGSQISGQQSSGKKK